MAEQKRANLGRGLAALLGDDEAAEAAVARDKPETSAATRETERMSVDSLVPNPYQPRRDFDSDAIDALASSIATNGILQPLLVRRRADDGETYEIIAGERRWRAAQQARLESVPVVVRDLSDTAALEIAIVENVQRRDLTALEEAQAYQRLMDEFAHTQDDLAKAVGKSRSHIANMLRLLQLPATVQNLVQHGDLAAGHARALLNADDPAELADEVRAKGLSVRETEKLAQRVKAAEGKGASGGPTQNGTATPDTDGLEKALARELGLRVRIAAKGAGGTVTVHYQSVDQLNDMLHRLRHGPDATDPRHGQTPETPRPVSRETTS